MGVAIDLDGFAAVLLDLDGTLYHEEQVLPGARELVERLQREGRRFACLSNSSSSPLRLMRRLERMGIDIEPDQICTAAAVAADYVLQKYGPGAGEAEKRARVFNLASQGIHEMLDDSVQWVESAGEPCDAVIAGPVAAVYATEERQRVALGLLRRGAELVGTSPDRVYPSPRGLEFGAGAMTAMLAYAAAVTPLFCGKPQAVFFDNLCQRLGVAAKDCLLIGDNLESDIVGAKGVGAKTVLTLTGVTRRRDLLTVAEEMRPEWVVEDLRDF